MGAHTCHRHIWGETGTTATTVAESERLRGAVGTIREGGVPLAAHPVWGSVAPPCAEAIRGAFSSRAESSGQGNVLLFPAVSEDTSRQGPLQCRERLGGLLKYNTHDAA